MNRIFRNTIFYLLIFLVIIGVVSFFNGNNQPTEPISYDKFMQELEAGNVEGDLTLQPERGVYEVRGQLEGQEEEKGFITYVWDNPETLNRIEQAAEAADVKILPAKETSGWVTFFTSIIPFIIIFILFFFLLNQAQGGGSVS
ncbi:cell division protein FtsH [Mesobacillus boroniphilus JCM 21738]|uniref:Cell division protein FtsH n=1 Tax=Mesobacillus boroniphilus JCM 21738 TaxID=1294265 RepID=W4RQZ5_9BACI|nr:cell division protein FtsH [Mesobacillus boroniphilus JCM 21738]